MSKVYRTKSLFTPSFLSMEYIEIVPNIDDDYDDDNSLAKSVLWETTQKLRENCAQFELFGEDLPSFASFWKQRFCCAGLAGGHPRRG